MATFYLIRHGKPDYTYGDTHGFIGQGHDFAPLKQDRIKDVVETSKDSRLKNAQIIVASPYTRALQTASIISKETGLEIVVEPDIREWQPDLTYQYKNSDEMKEYYKDYIENNVVYPTNEKISNCFKLFRNSTKIYESDEPVLDKYCVSITAKRRYIVPLVSIDNSYTRINDISDFAKERIDNYLKFKPKKYAYLDFDF